MKVILYRRKMRPVICCLSACLFLIGAGSAFAGDSALVSDGVLRVTVSPVTYAFQVQDWEGWGTDNGLSALGAGLGLEYGVNSWVNVSAVCIPGINYMTKAKSGNVDMLSDVYLGFKGALINGGGPIDADDVMKMSVGLGMTAYAPALGAEGKFPTDMHLWGVEARAWYDYTFVDELFTLNGTLGVTYYPSQQTSNVMFDIGATEPYNRRAEQPLKFDIEAEGRFQYLIGGLYGLGFYWNVPLRFTVIPVTNLAGDGMAWNFTTGASFTVALVEMPVPMDFTVKYEAPAAGKNMLALQRVTVLARFNFDFPKLTGKKKD